MSQLKVFINGKIVPSDKASLSIFDRGLLYGDGVFESLRTYNAKPFQLDAHLKRLFKSAKVLKIKSKLTLSQLKTAVLNTIAANKFKESYIKIIITRGEAKGHGLDPKNAIGKPTVIIIVQKQNSYSQKTFTHGWKAIISSIRRPDLPTSKIKSLNYTDHILAKMEAKKSGAQEAFLIDDKGYVVEGTISNLFIIKHGEILTPPKESPILIGLTRNLVIKLAKQSAFPIFEKDLTPKELYTADECFITFSGAGIVPITRIWQKKIRSLKCGPITSSLISLYNAETNKKI
jgi:branched-chain amino acid aminotransferase